MYRLRHLNFNTLNCLLSQHLHLSMEKNEGFSIPSVAEIKEANRIRTSSKPSLFEEKSLKKIGPNLPKISCSEGAIPPAVKISRAGVSKSGGASSSSSSDNHQNKATPATYHPHAIIANAMQVSKVECSPNLLIMHVNHSLPEEQPSYEVHTERIMGSGRHCPRL